MSDRHGRDPTPRARRTDGSAAGRPTGALPASHGARKGKAHARRTLGGATERAQHHILLMTRPTKNWSGRRCCGMCQL
jgi:hypothetical protein